MDRRIQKSKQAIMDAFMVLVFEKELEKITIGEIADKANVNRGTIYLHFTDKYDIRDKCLDYHLTELKESCIHDSKAEKITTKASLTRVFEHLEVNYEFYSAMLSNKESLVFRKRMKDIFKEGLINRLDLTEQKDNKEISVEFLVSAGVGVLEWWIYSSKPYSATIVVEQLWQLFNSIECNSK
ncbi:TetR/AcrR family transcriptional regulator [Anaerocolumna sp. AGMB13025]|uniref:TetR/AcrR family transcriptional regulator n=1 Tax=Anaerocolumna sp. AGMB13025 TaxID=3039116 RepID=UPI00242023C4|nr:TetR/AcrR family transcriptional regulator [Anaerocolumna sp. AGMB13025]WFR59637.1 TetR/AcrR family transcriptional regulator [Anaerocolumna sp. AGMB13025]